MSEEEKYYVGYTIKETCGGYGVTACVATRSRVDVYIARCLFAQVTPIIPVTTSFINQMMRLL